MKITFFESPDDFRSWLEANHAVERELWVGFYRKESGRPSITWPESVDEALCVGWIDGIRKRIDELSYVIRFSPRKPRSIWSAINTRRARELADQGRLRPLGQKAFDAREENRSGIYSYEQRPAELEGEYEKKFRCNRSAWVFFQKQPPSYRKMITWWVVSAKKEETREMRLARLIEASTEGRRL